MVQGEVPFDNLVKLLKKKTVKSGEAPWAGNPAVRFSECPWSSPLKQGQNYSPFGLGFTRLHVFAARGVPA